MFLWMCLALMTGAAVMAVLWPLSAGAVRAAAGPSDVEFYKDQIREIDGDVERTLLTPDEAEAARDEAGRRLLRAHAAAAAAPELTAEPALRRRRAASALALSIIPIVGLALYGAFGSPGLIAGTSSPPPLRDVADISDALRRIEGHLAAEPEDGRGWSVIAPVYLRVGRFDDAARAFEAAIRLAGETPERLDGYGEALVAAAGGVVPARARAAFERAQALDPSSARPAFYLALAAEQDGDLDRARGSYRTLLAAAPPDAPWRPTVERRLADLSAPPASIPAGAVTPEIAAMVDGLDRRLSEQGGSEDEWARLIRSLAVLGQRDEARQRLAKARSALSGNTEAAARLRVLSASLGLEGGAR